MSGQATVSAVRAATDTTAPPNSGVLSAAHRRSTDARVQTTSVTVGRSPRSVDAYGELMDDRKKVLRARQIAARRARSGPERAAAALANGGHLTGLLVGAELVCGYLPLATEPLTSALLDHLVAGGVTVFVPVVSPDAPLNWCRYPGPTEPGAFGIAEPTGPRLGADAVRKADAVVLPAFAVDPAGRRLGRGGGHYDRTLALLDRGPRFWPSPGRPRPELIAVLFDGEILDEVPADSHDIAVTAVVTPRDGLQYLPR